MSDLNVSIIVLSHGPMAEGIIKTASMLYGTQGMENVYSVCLQADEGAEQYKDRVKEILDKAGEEVLLFCDIYGGTPFNTIVKLSRERKLYAMAGVNVGLLMEALTRKYTCTAEEILNQLDAISGDSIVNITKAIDERMGK